MEQFGNLVYWEINKFKTSSEVLTSLGFKKYLPRNDSKAALIKTLRIVTRGNDKFYKKFADGKYEVKFAVVNPELIEVDGDIDIDFTKELVVTLVKDTGKLTTKLEWENQNFFQHINETYHKERGTIDSGQFRNLVTKFIHTAIYGVTMRKHGGIYFVDERKNDKMEMLRRLFMTFSNSCTLFEIPIYKDGKSYKALQSATNNQIKSDIDELIESLTNDGLTQRILKNKRRIIKNITNQITFHTSTLRSSADSLQNKLDQLNDIVNKVESGVKIETFLDKLAAL